MMLTYNCMGKMQKIFLSLLLTVTLFCLPKTLAYQLPNNNPSASVLIGINPKLSYLDALSLSAALGTTRCVIPINMLIALLTVESRLRINAVNKKTHDYGIAQINSLTIKRFGFDKNLLMNSYSYSLESACKVIKHHKAIVGKHKDWLGSYRAGTNFNSQRTRQNAKAYVKLINSTVAIINEKR